MGTVSGPAGCLWYTYIYITIVNGVYKPTNITGGHHPVMLGPISNSSITISLVTGRPLVSSIMTTPTAGRQVGGADFLSDFRGTKQNFLGTGHNQTCRLCYNPIKRVVKLNFVHLFLFFFKDLPMHKPIE